MSDWTGDLPIDAQSVRDFLNIEGTTGRYSDGIIGSNIRAAFGKIQRATWRQFERQVGGSKTFSTDGKPYIWLPDHTAITSATLQGTALTADASYWDLPDAYHDGVFTGIQFRAFGARGGSQYKSNPEWFDRNLDRDMRFAGPYSTLPNDLVVVADWGWEHYPSDLLFAAKVLAGFFTMRPASALADVRVTPDGTIESYSQFPIEVRSFIHDWMSGPQAVSVGPASG